MRTALALPPLLFLTALACSGPPRHRLPPGEAALTIEGRIERGALDLRAADLARAPRHAFRAREPRSGREAVFQGVSVRDLLADAVKPKRGVDLLVVRGRDGREALVALSRLRDLNPILADRADGQPLAEWARQAKLPLEAPLLAWPNLDQPGLAFDPRAPAWWVSGVSNLVLESWLPSYGRALQLPPDAGDRARRGAELAQAHCLPCHRIRGWGGRLGPELGGALQEWTSARLEGKLQAHAAEAGLPGGPEGEAARAMVAAFIQAVAAAPPPREEEREPEERAPGPEPPRRSPTTVPPGR